MLGVILAKNNRESQYLTVYLKSRYILHMKIHLSNSAFLGNIDAFIRQIDNTNPEELRVTANQEWISVHPIVLAMVAAMGVNAKPKVSCEKMTARSAPYLVRMKLFDFLGVDCGIKVNEHEPAGRFIPITQVKTSEQLTDFLTEMVPLLHLAPEQVRPIKYIVSELVRNVLEHACTPHGAFLAAQYFKKSNRISIGIVDSGIGIRSSLGVSHATPDDLAALRLALTPGITGTTKREGGSEQNAGAGLFFIKSIANVNRDLFVIYSGNAMYKLLKRKSEKIRLFADPFKDRHSAKNDLPYWKGTAVGIDISLDQTAEFNMLLDLISDTYDKAIKERKKEKHRKPKFI